MYIIELIYKIIKGFKKHSIQEEEIEDYRKCEHIFMPVDSTNKVLACSKCGIIKKFKTTDEKIQ